MIEKKNKTKQNKALYLNFKILTGNTILRLRAETVPPFYVIIREPREGRPVCGAKKVPSFLSYFKTLSIVPASGVEPATSRSVVKRSTDCANPAVDKLHFAHECWAYLYKFANLNTQDIGKLYIFFGCLVRLL